MKKIVTLMVIITMSGFIFSVGALAAQRGMTWKGSGGWGSGTPYDRMYNPQTVETIRGKVVSVDKIEPIRGMNYGVHLTVNTDKETISVHLGPAWYIENQDIKIAPGDMIEVKGSRIIFDGGPVLIAMEVKKGNDVLVLRDSRGFPVWSGWRRR